MNFFPWRKTKPAANPDNLDALFAVLLQRAASGAANSDERAVLARIMGRNPQTKSDVDQTNYLAAYSSSLWVNACVMARADACGSVPLKLRNKKTGDDIDDENHALLRLLDYVNFEDNWPWFVGSVSAYRDLAGEAFIKLDSAPQPTSMYILRPDRMEPVVAGGKLMGWKYSVGGVDTKLPLEEVIQLKRFSPTNDLRGQPIIQAGEISINLELAVRKHNNAYLRAGAIPPFMLTADGQLSADQVKTIKAAWKENHGGPEKAGEPFVHGNGLKLEVLSDNKKEGNYVDLARLTKGEILALFKTPPIVVQDYSDASVLANADVQERRFWRSTILDGEMTQILGVLNQTLVPRYGEDLELYADEAAMPQLQEDETSRWARVSQAVGAPFLKINEAREMLGLEPLDEEGDVVLVDPNLIALGEEPPEPPPPPTPVAVPVPAEAAPKPPKDEEEKPKPPPAKAVPLPKQLKSLVGEYGSEAHRTRCKAFLDEIEPQVNRIAGIVGKLNVGLLQQVISNLGGAGKGYTVTVPDLRQKAVADQYLFDLSAAGEAYLRELAPEIRALLDDGATRGLADLNLDDGNWDIKRPEVVEWLKQKDLQIKTLPQGLYDSIRLHLANGVERGATLQEMAKELQGLQEQYERSFAERIARTEVVGANNRGALEAYRQNDVKMKEWSSALDEEVRHPGGVNDSKFDHRDSHVKQVPLDEPFIVGGEKLQHPGDQGEGVSAGNVCNCRCVLLPVVDE